MDSGQVIIKTVLIAAFALVAIAVVLPGRGARGLAIQRLGIIAALVVGVVFVVVPDLTTQIASFLGIGRGVDLILYLLIVFFIGYVLTTQIRLRKDDRAITLLARKIALLEASTNQTAVGDAERIADSHDADQSPHGPRG